MGSLVDKSLVMLEERDEGSRYRMLETIRDYVREKLQQDGEEAAAAARHNDYYFELAKQANRGLDGAEQATWIQRLELELDNIRSAMALTLDGAVDPVRSVKFAVALQGFWILRSYATEGRRLVKAALALPEVESSSLAKAHALYVGAVLAESQGDHAQARRLLETCLVLRRELGDPISIAATLSMLSLAHLQAGDTTSASANEMEALEISRQQADRLGEAIGLLHLAQIAIFEGKLERARPYLLDGLAISHELDYRETEGLGELLLGELAAEEARLADAKEHYERSLHLCRDGADKRGEAKALWHLGEAALAAGDLGGARTLLSEALQAFRAADMWKELLGCLEDQSVLAHLEGRADTAVRLGATATAVRQRLGLGHSPLAETHWQERLAALRATLPDETFVAVWNEAREHWEIEDAVRAALASPPPATTQ